MALAGTIKQLQDLERGDDARAARADQSGMVTAWRHDIAEVFSAIRRALFAYESRGVAVIQTEMVNRTEELLGTHDYERLSIDIVGRRIVVAPVARFVVGAAGRLDMYRSNRPSEEDRVLILRGLALPDADSAAWWIEVKGEALMRPPGVMNGFARGGRRYRLMEPSSIESAVDHLLQLP